MTDQIAKIRAWHTAYMNGPRVSAAPYAADVGALLAEIDRLTAELAKVRADARRKQLAIDDLESRLSEYRRDLDAAIRERDSRAAVDAPRVDAECEECGGSGFSFVDEGYGNIGMRDCDDCHGTGRTEAAKGGE